ncbi:MAG: 23S rRNA (guanosine(2251)-2'-O)-methyltransferase RlmB [Syntrophobacteraceae bacterium CG07_land_8_20_14_0_80_61_8]|nr:MAG: 23S rRNA (guanosine(2251)-2'-O)-methyltransferase RlmB [Syntrophobacteraceae bacterium CG07_land_8_20_14_0_80_61_8]
MKSKPRLTEPLWVAGIHPVAAALEANQPPPLELVTCRGDARVQPLLELAARRRVPVRQLPQDALSRLCGSDHHQGVALRVGDFPYADLAAALARGVPALDPLVVLDCLQDPQNLGAILRSACFFGAAGALIPKDRSAAVTAAVIKIAAGATAELPVFRATNLARTLDDLKAAGLWVVGLDLEGTQSLYDLDLTMPLALVVGNEQQGLRRLIRERCDLLANIPGSGKIQSLNAANAAAAALAEIMRQRRSGLAARP